jgi:hypothetical protein
LSVSLIAALRLAPKEDFTPNAKLFHVSRMARERHEQPG